MAEMSDMSVRKQFVWSWERRKNTGEEKGRLHRDTETVRNGRKLDIFPNIPFMWIYTFNSTTFNSSHYWTREWAKVCGKCVHFPLNNFFGWICKDWCTDITSLWVKSNGGRTIGICFFYFKVCNSSHIATSLRCIGKMNLKFWASSVWQGVWYKTEL